MHVCVLAMLFAISSDLLHSVREHYSIGYLLAIFTLHIEMYAYNGLKGLSQKNYGGYCYIPVSIKISFQGLLPPII